MSRRVGRTHDCTKADGRTRLRQAELYLEVAETVLSSESDEESTVATGNAVLAAIAAADAICCAVVGSRYRGADHRGAVDHLSAATGDSALAGLLADLIDLKDIAHYGVIDVRHSRAVAAVRKAEALVAAARVRAR